jgi:hypothetical protein
MLMLLAMAYATLVARSLDPEGLARLSTGTAYGDVIAVRTEREPRTLSTVLTVRSLDGAPDVEVWLPGGCLDGICLTVAGAPTVEEGARIFVFLRGNQPTSPSQGLFRVEGDAARRDVRGLAFRDASVPTAEFALSTLLLYRDWRFR